MVEYPLLLKGGDTQQAYQINYDWSMVIDRKGIIRYSDNGVQLSAIQDTIDLLISTNLQDDTPVFNSFILIGNYPNPFNPATKIIFKLNKIQKISLKIYNAQGRLIKTLYNNILSAGRHAILWDGTNDTNLGVASGVYYYELQADGRRQVKRMILLR